MEDSRRILIFWFLLLLSGVSFAGNSAGMPANVGLANGVAVFSAGYKSGGPACASVTQEWAIDATSPSGKSLYALLLTAIGNGRSISVYGVGQGRDNCGAWPDRETANAIWLQ